MTIEVPFEVGQIVFYGDDQHIYRAGVVEAIETEVFIKIVDSISGDTIIRKPLGLYTKETALAFIAEAKAKIEAMA